MNNLVVNRAFTLNTGGISFNFELYFNIYLVSLSTVSMEMFQFLSEIFSVGLDLFMHFYHSELLWKESGRSGIR